MEYVLSIYFDSNREVFYFSKWESHSLYGKKKQNYCFFFHFDIQTNSHMLFCMCFVAAMNNSNFLFIFLYIHLHCVFIFFVVDSFIGWRFANVMMCCRSVKKVTKFFVCSVLQWTVKLAFALITHTKFVFVIQSNNNSTLREMTMKKSTKKIYWKLVMRSFWTLQLPRRCVAFVFRYVRL